MKKYATFLLGILYLPIFSLAAIDKFSGPVPSWFNQQFEKTFLVNFPGGLTLPYYGIACLEALTAALFLGSFFRRKFLQPALILSLITFAVLGFGLRLSHDFSGAFQLFGYFTLTFLVEQTIPKHA